MTRLYQITLFFLAPFSVIGGVTIFRGINKIVGSVWTGKSLGRPFKALSIYFVIFLLFQIGFVYYIAMGYSGSISISQEGIKKYGDTNDKIILYTALTPEQDIFSAKWLFNTKNHEEKVYATFNDIRVHALTSYGMIPASEMLILTNTSINIREGAYVYLQYLNVVEGIGTNWDIINKTTTYPMMDIFPIVERKNKIYSNGVNYIYK